MNKRELAKVYREMSKEEISLSKAQEEIEIFLETVQEALVINRQIKFVKKGTFEILEKKPRIVSNPSTRELMEIYPKKTVKFRVSKKIER